MSGEGLERYRREQTAFVETIGRYERCFLHHMSGKNQDAKSALGRAHQCLIDLEAEWKPSGGGSYSAVVSEGDCKALTTMFGVVLGVSGQYERMSWEEFCDSAHHQRDLGISRTGGAIKPGDSVVMVTISEKDEKVIDAFLRRLYSREESLYR